MQNEKPSEGIATEEVGKTPHASEVETKEEAGQQNDGGDATNLTDESDKLAEGEQPSEEAAVL